MAKKNADKDIVPKTKTSKKKAAKKKAVSKKTTAKKIAPKNVAKKKTASKKKANKSKISVEEKRSIIALHAYYRWENAGRPLNSEIQYWLEAEKEIEAQLKK